MNNQNNDQNFLEDPFEGSYSFQLLRMPLYKQVSSRIRDWIFSGNLKPKDKLPSEKELCERFKVSRTVIREALKELSAREFVTIKAGSGVFVKRLTIDDITRTLSQFLFFSGNNINDLLDIREFLECRIVEIAAQKATEEELLRIEEALKVIESEEDINRYLEGDLMFHSSLAMATHSDIFAGLINSIVSFLFDIRLQGFLVGGAKLGVVDHREIFYAVKRRDPIKAKEAMLKHLSHVRKDSEQAGLLHAKKNNF